MASMPFEILHRALMLFGGGTACECAEVAAASGPRIFLPRIEPVLAGCELADHVAVCLLHFQNMTWRLVPLTSCRGRLLHEVQREGASLSSLRLASFMHFPILRTCGARSPRQRRVFRHCEPTGPRVVARPDDGLREAIQRSMHAAPGLLRRYSASKTRVNALMAPRNDELHCSRDAHCTRVVGTPVSFSARHPDLRQMTPAVDACAVTIRASSQHFRWSMTFSENR